MGIRFLCHHCEKRLNVKSSQAGQDGQCPHCRQSITVPAESTIPSQFEKQEQLKRGRTAAHVEQDASIGLHHVDEQITLDGMPAEARDDDSHHVPKPSPSESIEFDLEDSNSSIELFMLDKPALPSTLGKVDPIAEAPDRVWYFRSRDLGEKGPLKAKAMRSHLEKGDVNIGCMVWREDWEDWIQAEKAFPTLVAAAKSRRKKARVRRAFKEANYQLPEDLSPRAAQRRLKNKNRIFVSVIAAGVLIIFVLLFVLFNLLSN